MASIRRTLSPVPRQNSANSEAISTGSPLSKSSSCAQTHPTPASGAGFSSLLGLSDPQTLLFRLCNLRSPRPLERSKPKGQFWKRALLHFFLCFFIGVFIGLAQFASKEFSLSYITKQQAFSSIIMLNLRASGDKAIESKAPQEMGMTVQEPGNFTNVMEQESEQLSHKLLLIITPTHTKPFQAYYLNRLGQMLKLVKPPLLWIVVEMNSQSVETAEILRKTGVMYRHIVCDKNISEVIDRRVHQRNVAMAHIEKHRLDGIVYFADDTNVYSSDLFVHNRKIRRFGTWKVAKLNREGSKTMVRGPVCNGTQIIGWHASKSSKFRKFHAELSGFAFNSTILWDPKRWQRPTAEPIRQVDTVDDDSKATSFIEQIVEDETQMEGIPENCSSVMVWDVRLVPWSPLYPTQMALKEHQRTLVMDTISPPFEELLSQRSEIRDKSKVVRILNRTSQTKV